MLVVVVRVIARSGSEAYYKIIFDGVSVVMLEIARAIINEKS